MMFSALKIAFKRHFTNGANNNLGSFFFKNFNFLTTHQCTVNVFSFVENSLVGKKALFYDATAKSYFENSLVDEIRGRDTMRIGKQQLFLSCFSAAYKCNSMKVH